MCMCFCLSNEKKCYFIEGERKRKKKERRIKWWACRRKRKRKKKKFSLVNGSHDF